MPQKTVYLGPFVHTTPNRDLDICESGAVGVDEQGKIAFIERSVSQDGSYSPKQGWESAKVVKIRGQGFFFPGFIDTHTHAPQFPNAGLFGSTTLLSWLETYTFPTESRFSSTSFAHRVYSRVISRLLSHGTTTAAYYATVHVPATTLLAELCLKAGQRAFVGRVCMDTLSPDYYRDASADAGIAASAESVSAIRALDPKGDLVAPIVTPRFAPSCTSPAMHGLAELAKRENVRIQTHVSENDGEIALVKKLFPDSEDYVDVYATHGLLGDTTVLAHAIHLSDREVKVLTETKTKVAHCPCSNSCLTSGAAGVRRLMDAGVDVGLGTDVSGGYSPSILEEARQALLVSRHVAHNSGGERAKLHVGEALYLATRGGAKVLGLEERVGAFEVGMEWDAIRVGLDEVPEEGEGERELEGPVDIYGHESWEDKVAKWVYCGDDRNTLAVWVKGRLVHERDGKTSNGVNGTS
ncbi:guanine deaminase [Myriangium duriaei CBS 260.36]|uniref:Guanine deaminase n=1 Tax=Myriangium duriaei CBS 260.36 TaxID=1168546 RepID=A0A9P4MG83_9PEZI|nr:guanine deaminase [Myriangium duriaei CBS 260.36]